MPDRKATRPVQVGEITIGPTHPLAIIAGPCALESREIAFRTCERMTELARAFDLPYIFKASYAKANRTSGEAYAGPGIDRGLALLAEVKARFDAPILTDVHEVADVDAAQEVADVLQIPAFLCRQTDLARACGASGRPVNVKKGQFLAAEDMVQIARKIESGGGSQVLFTERGTFFGYHDLVVDMRGLVVMRRTGYPVVYDATHSVQRPGRGGTVSGGNPEFILPLARAAVALGVDALFFETHPDPPNALCDPASQLSLSLAEELLRQVTTLHAASGEVRAGAPEEAGG